MKHRDVEAFIQCEGKVLPEYDVKIEDERTVSCFIPSEVGMKFEVHIREKGGINSFSVQVTIDGRHMGSSVCHRGRTASRWGVRTSDRNMRHPYQFSPLTVTDDDECLGHVESHAKIGEIELKAHRITGDTKTTKYNTTVYETVGSVHEKTKKSGVHCVSLGDAVPCSPDSRCRTTRLYPAEGTYVNFLFRYRPLEVLQAQAIAPLPPAQERPDNDQGPSQAGPSNRERHQRERGSERKRKRTTHDQDEDVKPPIDIDDEENLETLEEQLKKIQAKIQKVKRERRSPEFEGAAAKLRIIHAEQEVIDLTED
ncbi:hypothetical protein OBBRIDRAFT_778668 [Obba rivulosa]|uniref:DUF7918 domain-containing protein n=1 Tax=Obba rivulosa TaxID=1052685 RepID=A0A8E2DNA5_9APHY|nr:hypothetical protein OBBRIDRAFT_778668 [Obba rivulosa]